MNKYILFIFTAFTIACGTKKNTETVTAVKTQNNFENIDSLLGRWIQVEKEQDKYVHPVKLGTPETYIKIEKKDNEYRFITNNIDKESPGLTIFAIDSVKKVFAGSIINTNEYLVFIRNSMGDKTYELTFTPLHQSMQNAISINGFFDQNVDPYFINEKQKDKYSLKNETVIQQVSKKTDKSKKKQKKRQK